MPRLRHLRLGLSVVALLVASIGAPVSAASTVWVDADGAAGPDSCLDENAAVTTIKAGITAAVAGDTVRVCPGLYEEIVRVNKDITVVSDSRYSATIRPPASVPDPAPTALVTVAANGVTLRGLRLVVPSNSCTWTLVGISAINRTNTLVKNTRVLGGTTDESIDCGLSIGVLIKGGTGKVDGATIRNFFSRGVDVLNGATASVVNSTVLLGHTGTQSEDDQVNYPTFIHVSGASATITDNVLLHDPQMQMRSAFGVYLDNGFGKVGRNLIVGPGTGVAALEEIGASDVFSNIIRNGSADGIGIDLYVTSVATIRGNRVFDYQNGIYEHGRTGQIIKNNDFRGNVTDCAADTKHGTWTNNLGATWNLKGLCTPT